MWKSNTGCHCVPEQVSASCSSVFTFCLVFHNRCFYLLDDMFLKYFCFVASVSAVEQKPVKIRRIAQCAENKREWMLEKIKACWDLLLFVIWTGNVILLCKCVWPADGPKLQAGQSLNRVSLNLPPSLPLLLYLSHTLDKIKHACMLVVNIFLSLSGCVCITGSVCVCVCESAHVCLCSL